MHPFIQVRLTQRAAWLTWWVVTLPSREGGAGEGRSKSSNSQLNVPNSKHSLSQHFPIDLFVSRSISGAISICSPRDGSGRFRKAQKKMTNQQLRYFYHWPHFLYRIGYWITYQIECLIKEIMFEWVRDNLQTMLDLEMWAHRKMNKKHQIKRISPAPSVLSYLKSLSTCHLVFLQVGSAFHFCPAIASSNSSNPLLEVICQGCIAQ